MRKPAKFSRALAVDPRWRGALMMVAAMALTLAFRSEAQAQATTSEDDLPPTKLAVDKNGVNVTLGTWSYGSDVILNNGIDPHLGIGQLWMTKKGGWSNSWDYKVTVANAKHFVTVGTKSVRFVSSSLSGGQFIWDSDGQGTRLKMDQSTKEYTYIDREGITATLATIGFNQPSKMRHGYATRIVFPSGNVWSVTYDAKPMPTNLAYDPLVRARAIVSSLGVGARFSYQSDDSTSANWDDIAAMTVFNASIDYCPASWVSCNFSVNWPKIEHEGLWLNADTFVDANGSRWEYRRNNNRMIAYKYPNALNDTASITWDMVVNTPSSWGVTSHTLSGVTHTYTYADIKNGGSTVSRTTTVTGPNGMVRKYVSEPDPRYASCCNQWELLVKSQVDELGRVESYSYDSYGRVSRIVAPEGNMATYTFDGRGNITERRDISKTPGSPADRVVSYTFPTTCVVSLSCNKPSAKIDARGYQADYTYDPIHGGVLTETGPVVNGVRPQMRYSYALRYAWIKNAGGGYSQAASPVWVLASESYCRASAAIGSGCTVAGDEVVTGYEYGPDSGPNNLWLRGTTVTADNVTRRTCFGRDQLGRKVSEATPNASLTVCP